MKNIWIISLCFLAGCLSKKENANPNQIREVVNTFYDALKKNDTAGIKAVCTQDFRLVEDGFVLNADSSVRILKKMPPYQIQFVFTNYNAILDQHSAILTYDKQATFTMRDTTETSKWFESAFLLKEKDAWKLYLLHSSVIK